MGQVISLAQQRRRRRQAYLAKHGSRLDRFVARWVATTIDVDLAQLANDFQRGRLDVAQETWDYNQFRDVLVDALNEAFGRDLYALLASQTWFDRTHISRDEIIERCLSHYVLDRGGQAYSP